MNRIFCFLIFCSVSLSTVWGQTRPVPPEERGIQVSLSMSGITYRGDYREPGSSMRLYPGGQLTIQRAKEAAFKVRGNLGLGQVMEQRDGPIIIGQEVSFFATRFWFGDLSASWQPQWHARWRPWVSVGAGLIYFIPRDQQGRQLQNRPQTREPGESYNAIIPQLPAQIGLLYGLTEHIAVGMSYTYRFIPSDYLDNQGLAGSQSGFDALQGLNLTIQATIGRGKAKPEESKPIDTSPFDPAETAMHRHRTGSR